MCMACIEYTKDKLTSAEFKSALKEVSREDADHVREVERILQEFANDPERLKKELKYLEEF